MFHTIARSASFSLLLRLILLVAIVGAVALYLGVSPYFVGLVALALVLTPIILAGPIPFWPLLFAAIAGGSVFVWYLASSFTQG